jgi:hypothetical protein
MGFVSANIAIRLDDYNNDRTLSQSPTRGVSSSSEALEQGKREGAETRPRGGRAIRPCMIRSSLGQRLATFALSLLMYPEDHGDSPPDKVLASHQRCCMPHQSASSSSVGWWLGLCRADTLHLRVNRIHKQLRRFLNRQRRLSSFERRIFLPMFSPGA